MKKIIILSMLMLLGVGVRAADYGYLVFTLSDGTTKNITSTGVNITFADGKLTATAGTETVAVELASLTKMEFSNDGTTGISSVNCDFEAAEGTEIYDVNGRRMPSGSNLQRGVYIIKSNGKTTKVQVK